jgi:Putative prokaryotic signal transducing protein
MRRIYTAADIIQLSRVQGALESQGIHCQVRNEHLGGALGGLPYDQCWPELWVRDDDEAVAKRLVEREQQALPDGADWNCPDCSETVDSPLTECWNCGHVRDEA